MNKIELLVLVNIVDGCENSRVTASSPVGQPDLMFMRSVLVSTGSNNNDDVFLPNEMWAARATPSYKPVNWEHQSGRELTVEETAANPNKVVVDNQTIGVMYNTFAIDSDGQIIDENKISAADFVVPQKFHIVDEALIWKGLYPTTASRIERGAKDKTLFVSMEAWFNGYDYLVGNKVVARNEETAFLDKSLRANGGLGVFGHSRVKRVLRGLTFGGKGIVEKPANAPSIITSVTHEPMCAVAAADLKIQKNILGEIGYISRASEPTEDLGMSKESGQTSTGTVAPSVPLEQFTKAHDELATLRVALKAKEDEVVKATAALTEAQKQGEVIKEAFVKGARQLDSTLPNFSSRVTQGNPENFFSTLAEMLEENKGVKVELETKLKAALERIEKIQEDARIAARQVRLDALLSKAFSDEGKRKTQKEKLVASVKTLDDAAFDCLCDTLGETATMAAKTDESDKTKKMNKEEKAKQMAALLGVSEAVALATITTLMGEDKQDDTAILDSVKAKATPPAGEAPHGVDLSKAFGGLVQSMLKAHQKESK